MTPAPPPEPDNKDFDSRPMTHKEMAFWVAAVAAVVAIAVPHCVRDAQDHSASLRHDEALAAVAAVAGENKDAIVSVQYDVKHIISAVDKQTASIEKLNDKLEAMRWPTD